MEKRRSAGNYQFFCQGKVVEVAKHALWVIT